MESGNGRWERARTESGPEQRRKSRTKWQKEKTDTENLWSELQQRECRKLKTRTGKLKKQRKELNQLLYSELIRNPLVKQRNLNHWILEISLISVITQARIQTGLSGLYKPVRFFRDRVHPK